MFANWRLIHRRFCIGVWILALLLACIILMHRHTEPPAPHPARAALAR
jgi:hypothetical protein